MRTQIKLTCNKGLCVAHLDTCEHTLVHVKLMKTSYYRTFCVFSESRDTYFLETEQDPYCYASCVLAESRTTSFLETERNPYCCTLCVLAQSRNTSFLETERDPHCYAFCVLKRPKLIECFTTGLKRMDFVSVILQWDSHFGSY